MKTDGLDGLVWNGQDLGVTDDPSTWPPETEEMKERRKLEASGTSPIRIGAGNHWTGGNYTGVILNIHQGNSAENYLKIWKKYFPEKEDK